MAWRDPALEQTCLSSGAIEHRWPRSADAIKSLLWTVKHCRDLGVLLRHPSLKVTTDSRHVEALTVQTREAEMSAMALSHTGEVLGLTEEDQLIQHAGTTTALLVVDLIAEGSSGLREAI